jgi:hypothetical protein
MGYMYESPLALSLKYILPTVPRYSSFCKTVLIYMDKLFSFPDVPVNRSGGELRGTDPMEIIFFRLQESYDDEKGTEALASFKNVGNCVETGGGCIRIMEVPGGKLSTRSGMICNLYSRRETSYSSRT